MNKTWSTRVRAEDSRLIPCPLCGGVFFRPALRCDGFAFVRCRSCGLVLQNPQPSREAVAERYNAAQGGDYLSYEIENEGAFLHLQLLALRDAGAAIDTGAGKRALDIGCATGTLLAELRSHGWDAVGLELNAAQAEYAHEKRGLAVLPLDLCDAHLPAEHFHLVHASHLIEHLTDPAAFVREARRILAPDGDFIITTPNIDGFQSRLFKNAWRSAIFDHLFLFSKRTLTTLLEKNGFAVRKIATWGGLAAGSAPLFLKKPADTVVKSLGRGDVMVVRAQKSAFSPCAAAVKQTLVSSARVTGGTGKV